MRNKNLKRLFLVHLVAFVGVFLFPTGTSAQDSFVPLTSLPGLKEVSESGQLVSGESLPAFFNSLYRLAIGAAAILAVYQIIRAGIKFMTNKGSVSSNEEAKDLLKGAVFGIILVLSPVIVFGIINPDILKLDLNLGTLQTNRAADESSALAACNLSSNPSQLTCLQNSNEKLRAAYDTCITSSPVSACARNVQVDFRNKAQECGVTFETTQQQACVEKQTLSWLDAKATGADGNVVNQSCSAYDPKTIKQVPRNRDNTLSCPAGTEVLSDFCCKVTNSSFGCCAAKPGQTYISAYSMVLESPTTKKTCRQTVVQQYAKKDAGEDSCVATTIEKAARATVGDRTIKEFTWLKKCELGDPKFVPAQEFQTTCQ